jgi:hypothetical protein
MAILLMRKTVIDLRTRFPARTGRFCHPMTPKDSLRDCLRRRFLARGSTESQVASRGAKARPSRKPFYERLPFRIDKAAYVH